MRPKNEIIDFLKNKIFQSIMNQDEIQNITSILNQIKKDLPDIYYSVEDFTIEIAFSNLERLGLNPSYLEGIRTFLGKKSRFKSNVIDFLREKDETEIVNALIQQKGKAQAIQFLSSITPGEKSLLSFKVGSMKFNRIDKSIVLACTAPTPEEKNTSSNPELKKSTSQTDHIPSSSSKNKQEVEQKHYDIKKTNSVFTRLKKLVFFMRAALAIFSYGASLYFTKAYILTLPFSPLVCNIVLHATAYTASVIALQVWNWCTYKMDKSSAKRELHIIKDVEGKNRYSQPKKPSVHKNIKATHSRPNTQTYRRYNPFEGGYGEKESIKPYQ
ncbi:MAG: hypothetical protein VX112_03780 [Pseudomonadota bacterium]|nr:hypothetical protein [Pseudomonadota bacterium]